MLSINSECIDVYKTVLKSFMLLYINIIFCNLKCLILKKVLYKIYNSYYFDISFTAMNKSNITRAVTLHIFVFIYALFIQISIHKNLAESINRIQSHENPTHSNKKKCHSPTE